MGKGMCWAPNLQPQPYSPAPATPQTTYGELRNRLIAEVGAFVRKSDTRK